MIKNKVFKNASWIIGCKLVQAVLNIFISSLTARFLGTANFGVINYAASIVAFFVPIMQLGINSVVVQEYVNNEEEEGKIIGTSVSLCLSSALLSICGVFLFASIANAGERETIIVCVLYSLLLISQAFEMIQYWFQAKYLSKYTSIIMLVAYVITTAYKIFLLITKKSVYWFALSHAIDYILIAIGLFVAYKFLGKQKLSFSFSIAKRLISKGKYYIISFMMVTIFAHTDKIMIKLMIDNEATGMYSAAVACAGMTSFVFSAIIDSMRPLILKSKNESDEQFKDNLKILYSIVIYVALAQCLCMTLFAKLIIRILYGTAYFGAINILQIVVWYTTFSYIGAVRDVWILAEKKQKYLWIINLSGALTNVVLNAILIPLIGINGAALASLVTQIFTNIILGFIIKPIRANNRILLQALDPRIIIKGVQALLGKKGKANE